MDAARYARIRDLFLEAEELTPSEYLPFLESKAGEDQELINEVLSLLAEHDPNSARLEGQRAAPVQPPMVAPPPALQGTSITPTQSTVLDKSRDVGQTSPAAPKTSDTKKGEKGFSSEVTQHGVQRTHASPRYQDAPSTKGSAPPRNKIWDQRTRRNRRLNSGWLWLAAVLPTALIGWWTYGKVEATQRAAVRNELSGLANSVALSTEGFLDDKAQLVESWSRQPAIRQAIIELVEIAQKENAAEALQTAEQTERIRAQLQELSGFETIKYVIWDRDHTTIASWQEDRADIGTKIAESGTENHAHVTRGKTVLFGPERLLDEGNGFVPETSRPVMATIVPVRDSRDKVIAAMLVRGIEMFDEFDKMFRDTCEASGLDIYAVNRDGIMLTNSPQAIKRSNLVELELPTDQIAAMLRVSDPGMTLRPNNIGTIPQDARASRTTQMTIRSKALPLTYSVGNAVNGYPDVRVDDYNNYAGVPVVGAWRWSDKWQMGIIVEHDSATAFAPTRIVRIGFISLASLLTITAFAAATQIAKQTSLAHAAVHPLSRYELISELGSGGMGVVYHARHRQLGRETALKVLRGDRQNREDRMRFDREARLAASLSNPHSVMIYDYGRSDEGEAFCVMQFLKGITLYEVVMRSGHQPVGRVLFVLRQICDALAEAHNTGLLHRDMKPHNVMLSLDSSVGDWAVVFDFGLAKPLNPSPESFQTSETVWAGTPMYMAPERYRDPMDMNPRSDIYSIGCIAYFLLSGRPPYMECDPESLFAMVLTEKPIGINIHRGESLAPEVLEFVDRSMAKNPEERFRTVEEMSTAIDKLRANHPWTVDQAREWWSIHGSDD